MKLLLIEIVSQAFLGELHAFLDPIADQVGDGLRVHAGELGGMDWRTVMDSQRLECWQ